MPLSTTKTSIEASNKLQKLYKKRTKKKAEFDVLDADKENFSKLKSEYVVATRKGLHKSKELVAGNSKYTKWTRIIASLKAFEIEIKACEDKVCRCRCDFYRVNVLYQLFCIVFEIVINYLYPFQTLLLFDYRFCYNYFVS